MAAHILTYVLLEGCSAAWIRPVEISESLASALHLLVRAAQAAEAAPSNRQLARRAIEQASVVSQIAKSEGFGDDGLPGDIRSN